jgi:anti-anti-sigma factor
MSSERKRRSQLYVEVDAVAGRRTLRLVGELDLASAPQLDRIIGSARLATAEATTLDLSGLTFMDCRGLRSVVSISSAAGFQLVPGQPQIQRLFELTGLLDTLPFAAAA